MSTTTSEQQVHNTTSTTTIDQGTSTEKHDEVIHKKLEGNELLDAIRKQVEYYFSRQNLANDPYLVQHMNNQLYVPLDFVAGFKLVKNLTEDVKLIREALKTSKTVILDETGTKIKPDFNLPRNTVILRDIPSSLDVEVVRKIFSPDNMPARVQPQIGDNWFIIFDTDEQALLALDQIRGKEIDGNAVHARIKTENILKAFAFHATPTQQPQQQHQQLQQPQNIQFQQQQGYGRGYRNQQWDQNQMYQQQDQNNRGHRGGQNARNNKPTSAKTQGRKKDTNQQQQQPAPQKKGRQSLDQPQPPQQLQDQTKRAKSAKSRPQSQEQTTPNTTQLQPQPETQNNDQQHQESRTVGRGKRRPSFTRAHAPPSLGTKNFPPLPTISKAELLKSGYENDKYLSYPKGAIISVYNNNLKNNTLQKPDDMPECAAVLSTPKTQLELTKPPLPHHEVQQDPEHVEENEQQQTEHQARQQYLQQFDNVSTPKKTEKQPRQTSAPTTTSSVAPNELPNVVKSFAEAAITAKDIKTPDYPRPEQPQQQSQPQQKRRNSLKGVKPVRVEEESAPQNNQQPKSQRSRRSSIGGGKPRRNSLDNQKPTTVTIEKSRKKTKSEKQAEPLTIQTSTEEQENKPKRKKRNNKPKKEDNNAPAQSSGVQSSSPSSTGSQDNKSYASIVNKVKETPSPKTTEHQPSPKPTDNTTQQAFGGIDI